MILKTRDTSASVELLILHSPGADRLIFLALMPQRSRILPFATNVVKHVTLYSLILLEWWLFSTTWSHYPQRPWTLRRGSQLDIHVCNVAYSGHPLSNPSPDH